MGNPIDRRMGPKTGGVPLEQNRLDSQPFAHDFLRARRVECRALSPRKALAPFDGVRRCREALCRQLGSEHAVGCCLSRVEMLGHGPEGDLESGRLSGCQTIGSLEPVNIETE